MEGTYSEHIVKTYFIKHIACLYNGLKITEIKRT